MAYENYTTFTELGDPLNKVSETATKVDVVALANNSWTALYKDYGVAHFGDFTHYVDGKITASTNSGLWTFHGITNDANLNGWWYFWSNQYFCECALFYNSAGTIQVWLCSCENPRHIDTGNVVNNTQYYFTMVKSGTNLTLYIYTDAARTTLHDTLTVVCHTTTGRYIKLMNYGHATDTNTITCYNEYLDIGEAPTDVDSGVYVRMNGETLHLVRDDTSPVKVRKSGETIGLKLVAIDAEGASPIRIYTSSGVMAIKKMP